MLYVIWFWVVLIYVVKEEASFFTLDTGLATLRVMFIFNGLGVLVMGIA
jgi:hypothetical protein